MTDLRTAINDIAVFRCPPGFALKGIPEGTSYSWQFYPRRILTIPSAMQIIASVIAGEIAEIQDKVGPIQVGAMESAGPLMLGGVLALSKTPNVSYFVIRKDRKKYGLLNQIEGMIYRDIPIVLIDDISNSKNTLYLARKICESEVPGARVIQAITLINKGNDGADEISSLPVWSIFNASEFDLNWTDYFKDFKSQEVMDVAVHVVAAHKKQLWYNTESGTLVPAEYAINEVMKHVPDEANAIRFLINKFIQERML